jgi:hypothetical protein
VEPLDLDEVVKGGGGICGAAILDTRFEEFIRDRLGPHFVQLTAKGKQAMLSSWTTNIKFNFSGTGDDEDDLTEYLVVVPNVSDDPEKGIEGGMMLVDRSYCQKPLCRPILTIRAVWRLPISSTQSCRMSRSWLRRRWPMHMWQVTV